MMRRREFITLFGGAAFGPSVGWAQQQAMPLVGYLTSLGINDRPNLRDAFRRGLGETGYVDGRNVAIEYRYAENQLDRLPALATDLVGRKVAVIAATGGGAWHGCLRESGTAEYASFIQEDYHRYGSVVRDLGIQIK